TSDGTHAGTFPITRFAPDPLRQIDVPALRKDGVWYFVADDGVHGREVWRTDGTRQGTRLVIDLCPGSCSSDPRDFSLRIFGGSQAVYFTASNQEGFRALWRTDGTAPGTSRLTPPDVEATTGMLFQDIFDARTADLGEEMWVTGGTPGSTGLMVDLGLEEDSGSHPFLFGAAGDRLLFQTQDPAVGNGLWVSDGTAAGTQPIPAPPNLALDDNPYISTASLGARLLIAGPSNSPDGSSALWAADGTEAGGVRLTPQGVNVVTPPFIVRAGGTGEPRAVFSAQDEEHGIEVWVTEGTPESTHLLIDLLPGPEGQALLSPALPLRGEIVFEMSSPDEGGRLWITSILSSHRWSSPAISPWSRPEASFSSAPARRPAVTAGSGCRTARRPGPRRSSLPSPRAMSKRSSPPAAMRTSPCSWMIPTAPTPARICGSPTARRPGPSNCLAGRSSPTMATSCGRCPSAIASSSSMAATTTSGSPMARRRGRCRSATRGETKSAKRRVMPPCSTIIWCSAHSPTTATRTTAARATSGTAPASRSSRSKTFSADPSWPWGTASTSAATSRGPGRSCGCWRARAEAARRAPIAPGRQSG